MAASNTTRENGSDRDTFDIARNTEANQENDRQAIINQPEPSRAMQPTTQAPPTQRIRNYGCPDVALFDSEISADFGDRLRLNNASSWMSEGETDDYDKENQCIYRENIDDAEHTYANDSDLLCLYPSPAFSEEDAALTNAQVFAAS
ncbi:expressed unknown protein [Seminavis robusta]|uniref:Uncharacterized protein n=1 Tax=Seminavis robusta TaxID=568900 RepID=A0A9N8DUL0_9STRA|nr:expressed unknown protein [Seminavis robusta]|eukprot:Sro368_g128020.1 n/a (147) ;mRNA; f:49376-49816